MGVQWIAGIVFALWVSPLAWSGAVSARTCTSGPPSSSAASSVCSPALLAMSGRAEPSTRYTIAVGADADGRAADPPDRRPHRDALPRVRLAGVPRVLPRLARAGSGDGRGRARPHAARPLLAAIGVRRARREPVALARACGVGDLRRRRSWSSRACRSVAEMRQTAERTAALEQEVRTRQPGGARAPR